MLWRGGRKLLSVLVLLSFCSALVLAQPSSVSERTISISESELNTLISNISKLKTLNEALKLQLNGSSEALVKLQLRLNDLNLQLANLEKEAQSLKEQLQQSQQESEVLQEQLTRVSESYKSLYDSFLLFQKEAEKIINSLKKEAAFYKGLSIAGWTSAGAAVVWALIERFGR